MPTLEYFYDFSCPYAYLASTQVEALAARTGASLVYKPFLLGGVFKAVGAPQNMAASLAPARARLNALDMYRWAEWWGVPLTMPAGHPNSTVRALRATLASGDVPRASKALFAAYWVDARDLSDPIVVADALSGAGLDGAALVRQADDPAIKDELRARTDEAIERGVFGAPALFVGDELWWGQDRLDLVERALGGTPPIREAPPGSARATGKPKVEFWFDFSSPFTYLAATQVEQLAARTGVEITWRPFLLGGLFKAIGTPEVPLSTYSPAKQRHSAADLDRHAKLYGVPFRFTSRFPMLTVNALRLALAAGPDVVKLGQAIFRALWVDDRDVSSLGVLAEICREVGLDPALVERTKDQAVKDALRAATEEAQVRGLCGAPSIVVDDVVFWGQDRLAFAEAAIRGWRPKAG